MRRFLLGAVLVVTATLPLPAGAGVPEGSYVVVDGVCSGTAATSSVVITASHCVGPEGGAAYVWWRIWPRGALPPIRGTVVWDSAAHRDDYDPVIVAPGVIVPSPHDRYDVFRLDLAIIRLERPIPGYTHRLRPCPTAPETAQIVSFAAGQAWHRAVVALVSSVWDVDLGNVYVWRAVSGLVAPGSSGSGIFGPGGCYAGIVTHGIPQYGVFMGAAAWRVWGVLGAVVGR